MQVVFKTLAMRMLIHRPDDTVEAGLIAYRTLHDMASNQTLYYEVDEYEKGVLALRVRRESRC